MANRKIRKPKEFTVEYCPRCKDTKIVKLGSGPIEVFQCENCRFVYKKEKKKK